MFNIIFNERSANYFLNIYVLCFKKINIVIEVYLSHKKRLVFDEIYDKFKHNIII